MYRSIVFLFLFVACGLGQVRINPETGLLDIAGPTGPQGPQGEPGAGITTLNTLTALTQTFAVGTTGVDFNIISSGSAHTFHIPNASATNRGLLLSADWSIFNAKEAVLSFSSPLLRTTNTISIQVANGSQDGYLASADWVTFNAKYGAGASPSFAALTISGDFTRTGMADGCGTWASGVLGSTGVPCGSGSGGLTSLNTLTGASQTFATGTAGTDFGISSSGTTHTFNLPSASGSNRGLLTSADWTTFNGKYGSGANAAFASMTVTATGAGTPVVGRTHASTVATDPFFGVQNSSNTWLGGLLGNGRYNDPNQTSGAAVFDTDGTLVKATGTASDCVKVDGSSGACGSGGGTPGGSDGQLQYNNAGSFGGIASFLRSGTGASEALTIYNPTATTGVTSFVLRAGAGQSTNSPFSYFANDGTTLLSYLTGAGAFLSTVSFSTLSGGSEKAGMNATMGLGLASDRHLRWSNGANWTGTKDLGISRNAAGVAEVNDGITPGTLRDLLVRNITASTNITRTGMSDGCAAWASGTLGSTGSACGSGGGAAAAPYPVTMSGTQQTITYATHGISGRLQVSCLDGSGDNSIVPYNYNVADTTADITIGAFTGECAISALGSGVGDVTAALALTADLPVFGDGGDAVKVGTKTGTGTQAVMSQSPTIVTPVIASFASANHNHTNSAGGGQLTDAALSSAVTVAKGGTGLTSGTSGGVPYFSGATTIASSGALTANMPVFGGGAGAAPVVGTRSGNTTQVVTTTGAQTSGRCVEIDANGNHIAAAAGCGSGSGSGDVVGPSSATDNAVAVYDSTTGKLIKVGTGCSVSGGAMTCTGGFASGDGTVESAVILPELTANGSNDFRIYGAANQAADGCIVVSGQPGDDQILKGTASTVTLDGKTCRVMAWEADAGSGLSSADIDTSAELRAIVGDETGTGALYFQGGDIGTPSAGVLTNATGLPIASGVSGLGTGIATVLATPSSANLRAALTDESGTGAAYFQGGDAGTPSAIVLTNATGFPTLNQNTTGTAGGLSGTALTGDVTNSGNTLTLAAKHKTRQFGFMLGADDGSALVDTNDQPTIFSNQLGFGITITRVWCETDTGTSTINLQRDDGSPANILSSNVTCSTTGAVGTIDTAEDNVADTNNIDLVVVAAAASGAPKRISIFVRYTVD